MANEKKIQKILMNLGAIRPCSECGTRLRFGDWECPHCGADLEDYLREWAENLINEIESTP